MKMKFFLGIQILVVIVLLTACTQSASTPVHPTPSLSATDLPPAATQQPLISDTASPAVPGTTAPPPTLTRTPYLTPTPSISPTDPSPSPTSTLPLTPYFFRIENIYQEDLLWQECVVSEDLYQDWSVGYRCFGESLPTGEKNRSDLGEYLEREESEFPDLVLELDNQIFETFHAGDTYSLYRNDEQFLEIEFPGEAYNPQRSLQWIGDQIIWEMASDQQSVIYRDQESINQERNLEGAYYPYAIADQLLYIGSRESRYQLYYNDQPIGGAFDQVSIGYCCAPEYFTVQRVNNEYWFWGIRSGRFYLVMIKEVP